MVCLVMYTILDLITMAALPMRQAPFEAIYVNSLTHYNNLISMVLLLSSF